MSRLPPETAPPKRTDRGRPVSRKDDEHALAEIRHELGNRFQRLYFWADQGGGEPADGEAPRAKLAGELVSLEAYFRSVLEYFSEPGLNTVEVPVADLVERLRSTVPDREVEVDGIESLAGMAASVDPGLLSGALELVGRRVDSVASREAGLSLVVRVERGGERVELELSGQPGGDGPGGLLGDLEAMIARRCLLLHGGDLTQGSGPASVVVTLPLD